MTHDEILQYAQMMSDFFKQLLTINTGMILLIIGGVEKIFTTKRLYKSPLNLPFLIVSVCCFVGSLLWSLNALRVIAFNVASLLQGGLEPHIVDDWSLNGAISLFGLGMVSFLALAILIIRGSKSESSDSRKNISHKVS